MSSDPQLNSMSSIVAYLLMVQGYRAPLMRNGERGTIGGLGGMIASPLLGAAILGGGSSILFQEL